MTEVMFNTGNAVPSPDPKDRHDNSLVLDAILNGTATQVVNRVGQLVYTMAYFNTLMTNGQGRIDTIVASVNTYATAGKQKIDVAVTDVESAATAGKGRIDAAATSLETEVKDLSDNLGNKGFNSYAAMLAYVPKYDGTLVWVRADADPARIGFYQWNKATATWIKPYPQPALTSDLERLLMRLSVKKAPRGPGIDWPISFGLESGTKLLIGMSQKLPRGVLGTQGAVPMLGNTPLPGMVTLIRPRSRITADTVLVSGESIMLTSEGGGGTPVDPVDPVIVYDAKQIQLQGQKVAPKRFAAILEAAVWAYENGASKKLTQIGTWLAAQAGAFDIVRALKAGTTEQPTPQSHSITRDGRMFREGRVLLHKLVTGQSLALGSRGIVIDPNGEYVINGVRGNLFTRSTPTGFDGRMLTLLGGPRPGNYNGTNEFYPVQEYVSGVVAETPATSYMLSSLKWLDANTSINAKMLYTISALGGTPYSGLKKGSTPYTNAINQVTNSKRIAESMGLDYAVYSMTITHGESQTGTTQAEYVAMQKEWMADYQADIAAITGQPVAPVGYISQMLTGDPGTIPAIPLAQMQAHEEDPSLIMVGPKYDSPYFDTYHMLAEGYVKYGEREARAERLTQNVSKWQPLKVVSTIVSGNTITLNLNNIPDGNAATPGPIGRLVVDTELVTDPGNAGFLISSGSISSVVAGYNGTSIVITLAASVVIGSTLTYALQPSLNAPQSGRGRRGCIRDTDMRDFSRYDDKPVYNWLCAFSKTMEI